MHGVVLCMLALTCTVACTVALAIAIAITVGVECVCVHGSVGASGNMCVVTHGMCACRVEVCVCVHVHSGIGVGGYGGVGQAPARCMTVSPPQKGRAPARAINLEVCRVS